ncbi:hypothetical protein ACXR0O_29680 [Verrucomicrobiota bacterium sgz303538]
MNSKLTKAAIATILILLGVASGLCYRAFNPQNAWVVESPANGNWKVILTGHDFRVHDLRSSPFRPRQVCRLFWLPHHWPTELHWSGDGSVAAILVDYGNSERFYGYGCGYDFRNHQMLRTGSSHYPLEASAEFDSFIKHLLEERGGIISSAESVPNVPKAH